MKIITNFKEFETDIIEILLLFFSSSFVEANENFFINHSLEYNNDLIINKIALTQIDCENNSEKLLNTDLNSTDVENTKQNKTEFKGVCISEATYQNKIRYKNEEQKIGKLKNEVQLAVYKFVSSILNKKFVWGTLTNKDPIKIAKKLINLGEDASYIEEYLIKYFAVESKKAKLVSQIINSQKSIINNENLVNLYINIPSSHNVTNFINYAINNVEIEKKLDKEVFSKHLENVKHPEKKYEDLIQTNDFQNNELEFSAIFTSYLNALIKEIKLVKKIISKKAYVVKSIYIGGDVALLNANELDILLGEFAFLISQFTVECGSPSLLTKNKLQILKNHGVSRISLNLETFTLKTLKLLKKNYDFKDILNFYKDCIELDFNVNIDITAGLKNENFKTFKKNIAVLLELSPDNITINVNAKNDEIEIKQLVEMINFANEKIVSDGYKPCFLLKENIGNVSNFDENLISTLINENNTINQFDKKDKTQKENFEINNKIEIIGYCKTGKQSNFEIDAVEGQSSIIACGANSTSSIVIDNFKQRQANPKSIFQYIKQIDKIINEKLKLFK